MSQPSNLTPRRLRNFVGGEYVDPDARSTLELVNPATGQVVAEAPVSSEQDVDRAYRTAAKAFETWGETTPSERQQALLKIADAIEARADELIALESENTGKPRALTASEEIPPMVDQIRFFAGAARVLEGRAAGEYMKGHTSWVRREPIGVVGQVTPWNYPMMMAVWKFAPALAAGNTVVLKPSDTTPETTLLMAEIAAEFLPPGVLNVITGNRDTGRALVEHEIPAMVSITGSVRAGMEVAGSAARDVKRVHLELGGKAPVVVFDDADLEAAAEAIAVAGYFNAGQDCTAATRVLAAPRHPRRLRGRAGRAGALGQGGSAGRRGRAARPGQQRAPARPGLRASSTACPTTRASPPAAAGSRASATASSTSRPCSTACVRTTRRSRTRSSGPVITVQQFSDEAQAIAWANGVNYGLASSVWTKDFGKAMRMSKALDFGCVWINTHIPLVAEMPHGGFKHSGYGKDLSMYGFEDYTRIKHVMANIES